MASWIKDKVGVDDSPWDGPIASLKAGQCVHVDPQKGEEDGKKE